MPSELSAGSAGEELAAWIRLTHVSGVGGESQRRLLQSFESPEAIFAASRSALTAVIGATLAERLIHEDCNDAIAATRLWLQESGNHVVTLADADYPRALLTSVDPPVLLYAKGRRNLLNAPAFAIVGSRNATKQGEANAQAFAAALASAGLVIVSGLALGIDAAAHRGALGATGATIAIIGTGADRIYPARNADLARAIAETGLIISEFALGTPPLAANFPRRNRLIAGLARGCLVVEAADQSGSLITARLAADAGCDVFAIPGSIHSPLSRGCHKLIRQGAKLVESAQDILEELKWDAVTTPATSQSAAQEAPPGADDTILAAIGADPCDLDTLAERTGLSAEALLPRLLPLELDGRIARLPGGRYQRLH